MEVSSVYFRRLLQSNASNIFITPNAPRTTSAGSDGSGSYPLLVSEIQKLTRTPQQSYNIAEALDTSDGDVFRDFDLSTFMDHFRLDPVAKITVALACRTVSKQDIRTKGTYMCFFAVCPSAHLPPFPTCPLNHSAPSPHSTTTLTNHPAPLGPQPMQSSPATTTTSSKLSPTPPRPTTSPHPLSPTSSHVCFKTHRGNGMTRRRPTCSS